MTNDEYVYSDLVELIHDIRTKKPNDRSEKDRHYAVFLTELEKAMAYFYTFVMSEEEA